MTRILLVEDEVLIARELIKHISNIDNISVSHARSYNEALELLSKHEFALLILDIRIYGDKSGIDIARYINENQKTPFIYLTSHFDESVLQEAKETKPVGYLTKPFQLETLRTTIEIALFNHLTVQEKKIVLVSEGKKEHRFKLSDMFYLSADHVYTNIHCKNETHLVRSTLNNVMLQLPSDQFIRIHRSYAVNIQHAQPLNSQYLTVHGERLPIGRTYRENVVSFLNNTEK
ncbi:MAG: response regulator [Bacteroidetes bacterium]|nr:response regulator [Bacteroidota bacterium]